MFRELIRKNKKLEKGECIELLERETRGVLAVNGDGGYPYASPMNYYYCPEDGCVYFHCGKVGHRLDSIRRSDKVSFCVCEKGYKNEGEWAYNVRSVILFGKIEIIDDLEEIGRISYALSRKFTSDEEYIQKEIAQFAKATLILKLIPDHISGKRIKEE